MRTSNKILLIFFINVFLIPLCLYIGYAAQVRKGKFTRWKNDSPSRTLSVPNIGTYSVVKISAPETATLNCRLTHASTPSFQYLLREAKDSISIHQAGDTLFVNYEVRSIEQHGEKGQLDVEIYLPLFDRLLMNNANAAIVSTDTSTRQLSATLLGKGGLTIEPGHRFDRVSFNSADAALSIQPDNHIGELELFITGGASIQLEKQTTIGQVSGSISDSTRVSGSWEMIKRMAVITKK